MIYKQHTFISYSYGDQNIEDQGIDRFGVRLGKFFRSKVAPYCYEDEAMAGVSWDYMIWALIMKHISQHLPQFLGCICEETVSRDRYLHTTSHVLHTNHLINIRFLGGKEFRWHLHSMTPEGQKRTSLLISLSHPSEKYLEILQVCNT